MSSDLQVVLALGGGPLTLALDHTQDCIQVATAEGERVRLTVMRGPGEGVFVHIERIDGKANLEKIELVDMAVAKDS